MIGIKEARTAIKCLKCLIILTFAMDIARRQTRATQIYLNARLELEPHSLVPF